MMIDVGAGGGPQGARRRGQLLGTGPLNVASLEARQDFKIDSQGAREYRCDRPFNHGTDQGAEGAVTAAGGFDRAMPYRRCRRQ